MAPKNLGSMGYAGVSGHWIPNEVQSHAYSTQGKALEFYRSWNASWNQPSNFFSSVLSIDRSKMALCNASGGVLANDAIMRRHVRWTGDIDGVVINNDTDTRLCQQTPTGTNWKYRGNLREAFSKGAFGWFTLTRFRVWAVDCSDWSSYRLLTRFGQWLKPKCLAADTAIQTGSGKKPDGPLISSEGQDLNHIYRIFQEVGNSERSFCSVLAEFFLLRYVMEWMLACLRACLRACVRACLLLACLLAWVNPCVIRRETDWRITNTVIHTSVIGSLSGKRHPGDMHFWGNNACKAHL